MEETSRLQALLEAGHFVVTTEVGPPKGATVKSLRRTIRALSASVDAINVTDNQAAVVRLCSLAGCVHVLAEGAEPVLHMTCRDRNRIGLQSDLLGAYSLGVRNVLLLTGDSPTVGNHPDALPVFDVDSVQLCQVVSGMRHNSRFMNGEEMKSPPRFFVGCGENPFGDTPESRVARLEKKVQAGADFVQTQPVFDLERFERWVSALRVAGLDKRISVIAGLLPIRSRDALSKMAQVPGIHVPEEIHRRFRGLSEEEQTAEGLRLAQETIQQLRTIPGVSGVHIMAVGWYEAIPEIAAAAGLLPRPDEVLEKVSGSES